MRTPTKEHYYPKWLIKLTGATGVRMKVNGVTKWVHPNSTTIPLCEACNQRLGSDLESPVKSAFADIEAGLGISDREAELLIRWLWKFETWNWLMTFGNPEGYNRTATPIERLTGSTFHKVRGYVTLSIGMCVGDKYIHADGKDHGMPLGLDTPTTLYDADCVIGVFNRLALGVSLRCFDQFLPRSMQRFHLLTVGSVSDRDKKTIFPMWVCSSPNALVDSVLTAATPLKLKHEEWAQKTMRYQAGLPRLIRPSLILPSRYQ